MIYSEATDLLKALGVHRLANIHGVTSTFMFEVNDECTRYSLSSQMYDELTKKEFEELQQILDEYVPKNEGY